MKNDNEFKYSGPGYYTDRDGRQWLVGRHITKGLVGIDVNKDHPSVFYWSEEGRVFSKGTPCSPPTDLVRRLNNFK